MTVLQGESSLALTAEVDWHEDGLIVALTISFSMQLLISTTGFCFIGFSGMSTLFFRHVRHNLPSPFHCSCNGLLSSFKIFPLNIADIQSGVVFNCFPTFSLKLSKVVLLFSSLILNLSILLSLTQSAHGTDSFSETISCACLSRTCSRDCFCALASLVVYVGFLGFGGIKSCFLLLFSFHLIFLGDGVSLAQCSKSLELAL